MATTQRFHANNVSTTLSAAIVSTSATSITVTSATGFPTISTNQFFSITVTSGATVEIMQVTGVSGTTLTVVRGAESTTASTFANGSTVGIYTTADSHDRKCDLPPTFHTGGVLGLAGTVISSGTSWIQPVNSNAPLIGSTSGASSFAALALAASGAVSGILATSNGGYVLPNLTTSSLTTGTSSQTLGSNTVFAASATTSTCVFTLTLPSSNTAGFSCNQILMGNGATWVLKPNTGIKIVSPYGQTSAGGSITSTNTYDTITVKYTSAGFWIVESACFASGTPWTFA